MMASTVSQAVREKRVSVRMLWPFARLMGPNLAAAEVLSREGVDLSELVRPDARLPHRLVIALLETSVASSGDPALGLHAGESVEAGEFDTLEYAARSCVNLREALRCAARYIHLMNEAVEASLVEEGDASLWRCRVAEGLPTAPALNDFILASGVSFARRYTGGTRPALEVHVAHPEPAYKDEYERVFQGRVRFNMPHNGFLLSQEHLDLPMVRANLGFQRAFEMYARELSDRVGTGLRSRARELVTEQLRGTDMCMESVARALAMSVPTLRRRLEEEGTTFSAVVDDVRRDLAERYLREPHLSISEIAFLLGFSHAPAFHKAFKRWKGTTPSEHRARM